MDWFKLQPLSIPTLAQLVMTVAILSYLLTIRDKSRPTRLLIIMFVGFGGFMLFQFLHESAFAPWRHNLLSISTIFGMASFIPMVMFAYTFLGNPFEREYRVALPILSIVVGLLCLLEGVSSFGWLDWRAITIPAPARLIAVALVAFLAVLVFVRKAIVLRKRPSQDAHFSARAHRDFALAFIFIPLTIVPAIFRDLGYLPRGLAGSIGAALFLLFFFAFVLVFLNHAPEPTTVQVKLVGLSFVTVLVVLSFAIPISNPRIVLQREAEWIVSTNPELDFTTVYREHAHNRTIGGFWVVVVTSGLVLGLFPIFFRSTLLSRLDTLLGGVRRVNEGDLSVEVESPIGDEIGYLTSSFNEMTASLRQQIEEITNLTQQAARAEFDRKLLEAENERKTRELEEARRLQLSMLPKEMPDCAGIDMAAVMETATEVGGDYYDFVCGPGGSLTAVIGDATGHGMNAGTVVAATKGLYHAMSEEENLAEILKRVSFALKKMNLPGLYMALGIARVQDSTIELVGSGLPPALVFRSSDGSVEEYPLKGAPLGSFLNFPYKTVRFALSPGDAIVMITDGFPELFNPEREMLGYDRAAKLVAQHGAGSAEEIIDAFKADAARWAGGHRPDDDITVVVLKVRS